MKWFTSDWHFGHKNILEYCNRPFNNLEEMHTYFLTLWNSTVKPEDTIYFLGDFSLNRKWSKLIVPQLAGKKILIPGNHDEVFAFKGRNIESRIQSYKEHGWNEIHQTLDLTLKDGTEVLLSHLPYGSPKSLEFDDRYQEYRPKDEGKILLSGHTHGKYQKLGRIIDVGYDAHHRIISEDDVINIINDKRDFIPVK